MEAEVKFIDADLSNDGVSIMDTATIETTRSVRNNIILKTFIDLIITQYQNQRYII